jgi:hypothetical protein
MGRSCANRSIHMAMTLKLNDMVYAGFVLAFSRCLCL